MMSHVFEEPWDCVSELRSVQMSCFRPARGFKEFIKRVPLIIPDFIVAVALVRLGLDGWAEWSRHAGLGRLVCKR